ncbi:MAG: hypothetical protein ACRCYY_09525 [Trueperaceae bacterium]
MQGKLSFPLAGVIEESSVVATGETFNSAVKHASKVGDPVEIEGWCFNEKGEEVGYTKVLDRVIGGPVRLAAIHPPLLPESEIASCLPILETRGKSPCLRDVYGVY